MLAKHGRWKLKVENNVMMQWFADSWNEEAVVACIADCKKAAQPLIGTNWAIISIFENWKLGVPSIEKHVTKYCGWFKEHGCVKDCHVYSPDAMKEMQLEKMIPVSEPGYERRVFTNLNDAVEWLESEGFNITDHDFLQAGFNMESEC
jgi:hypothetical protein